MAHYYPPVAFHFKVEVLDLRRRVPNADLKQLKFEVA